MGLRDQYGSPEKYQEHLLEQYKVYVDTTEHISDRRQGANSFFLTINTALVALISYVTLGLNIDTTPRSYWLSAFALVAFAGIVLSYMWYQLIRSYRDINSAKFKVIHEIEKSLPLSPFDAEWEAAGRGENPKLFRPFTKTEAKIPLVFLAIHLVVFLVAFTTAFGISTDKKPTYRIGLGPWVGFGPLYLAKEKGYFDEAGLNIDLIVLTGLAERNSALKAGRIDALAAPVDYFVLSAGNRLETTIVMSIDESIGGDGIVTRKDIKRFEDLRGKKVAFQRGLPSEFFLRALLEQHGVKLEELAFTDLETAEAGAAFIAGKVDAAVVWEPWLSRAKEEGGGRVLASTKEYPNLIVDCLAFTKEVVGRSPKDVQKIVNAVLKAIDFWKQNPEEANRIMAPYFQVDPEKYALILSGARFTDLSRNRQYFGTTQAPGPIFDVAKRASEIWLSAKAIDLPVKPNSIVSTRFIGNEEN